MKLDREEQKETLLKLLGTVTFTVNAENASQTAVTIGGLMDAIRGADIEDDGDVPVNRIKENSERPQEKAGRGVGTEG